MVSDTDLKALSCEGMMDVPRVRPVQAQLDGITHKSLADALKLLERRRLVTRTVLPTSPIGVEYATTSLSHSLREPFYALCAWALEHEQALATAAVVYDRSRD